MLCSCDDLNDSLVWALLFVWVYVLLETWLSLVSVENSTAGTMWWETLPSFFIIVGAVALPSYVGIIANKLIFDHVRIFFRQRVGISLAIIPQVEILLLTRLFFFLSFFQKYRRQRDFLHDKVYIWRDLRLTGDHYKLPVSCSRTILLLMKSCVLYWIYFQPLKFPFEYRKIL